MKFKSYLIFFLLFGLLPDVYLLTLPASIGTVLYSIPTLAALVALVLIGSKVWYTESLRVFSYLIFITELPGFVFLLISLLLRSFLPLQVAIAAGAGVGLAVSAYFSTLIFYTSRHLAVNTLELSFEGLPAAFDGLRICQMTDLHLGSFGKKARYVTRVVDQVLKEKPDVILFTGDLVNFVSEEADSYLQELRRLKAPMGIYAIRGNHDYLLHGPFKEEDRIRDTRRLLSLEQGLGWNVLMDQHVILEKDGERMAIAGVENVSSNPYFRKMGGNLKKAIEGIPEGLFTILLTHDPSHWSADVVPSTDIPLTLSGHTHGLKYKTAGINPEHWKLPLSRGIYSEGRQVLNVSKGLGSAFAFRLGGYPEIDIITLKTQTK